MQKSLDHMQKMFPAPETSEDNGFVPIRRDPESRRRILTDQARALMVILGPFQPKLSSYLRNNEIPQSKQCRFS